MVSLPLFPTSRKTFLEANSDSLRVAYARSSSSNATSFTSKKKEFINQGSLASSVEGEKDRRNKEADPGWSF